MHVYLYMCVCAYVQVIQVNTGAKGGQEKAMDPLELEL